MNHKPKKTDKIGIYVDGANMFYGLKGARIDYAHFLKWLAQGRNITQASYFNASQKENSKMQDFFNHVRKSGFKCYIKQTTKIQATGEWKQAGIDVFLTVKAIRWNRLWDTLVIVSGDYDYLPLIDEIKNGFGKKVEVVSFDYCMHPIYKGFTHRFIDDYMKTLKDIK